MAESSPLAKAGGRIADWVLPPSQGTGTADLAMYWSKGGLCTKCRFSRMLGVTAPTACLSFCSRRKGASARDNEDKLHRQGRPVAPDCWVGSTASREAPPAPTKTEALMSPSMQAL